MPSSFITHNYSISCHRRITDKLIQKIEARTFFFINNLLGPKEKRKKGGF